MELRMVPLMVVFIFLMMATLITQHLVYHWDILMDMHLALMKASRLAHLMMKCWPLHLEMMMKSHFCLMKE